VTPDEVERAVAGVEGWLGPLEGRLLYRLGHDADPSGSIVEIGSWHGKSTIWLAAGAKAGRGARVVAIDPHRDSNLHAGDESTEPILRRNLAEAGVDDQVDVRVATSEEAEGAWAGPVSLLWIDGDHSYESASSDFALWAQHVVAGGRIALHDTFLYEGPERVVRERMIAPGGFDDFGQAETITVARKADALSAGDAARRRLSLARRSLYGARLRAYDDNTLWAADIRKTMRRLVRR
jgi:predicted O-methyltransferase YrrM